MLGKLLNCSTAMGHMMISAALHLVLICFHIPDIGPFDDFQEFIDQIDIPDFDLSDLSPEDLEFIPPELLFSMAGGELEEMVDNFSPEQLNTVCENLLWTDPDTAEQLMGTVSCAATFSQLSAIGDQMSQDMEKAAVAAMRKAKARASWSSIEWSIVFNLPEGLLPEDIIDAPINVLLHNLPNLNKHAATLEAELADTVIGQVVQEVGDFGALDGTMLAAMGGMLQFLDFEDLQEITKTAKKEALGYMKGVKLPDVIIAELSDDLLEDFGKPADWSHPDLLSLIDFIKYQSEVIKEIPVEALLKDLGNITFGVVEALGFTDELLKAPEYANAESWDAAKMADAKHLMVSLPLTFMERLNDTAIFEAINLNYISDVDFPKSTGHYVFEKFSMKLGGVGKLDPGMLDKLEHTLKSIRSTDVSGLDPNAAFISINTFSKSYDEMAESARAALLDKFRSQTLVPGGLTGFMSFQLGPFFKELSMDDVDALPFYMFNATYVHMMEPVGMPLTQAQSSRVLWNLEKRFGSPANFTMKMWITLGDAICGISCDVIRMLPDNSHFRGLVSHIAARRAPCLGDAQTRCMAKRVRAYLWGDEISGSLDVTRATKKTISKVGTFLPYLSEEDLRALPMSVCSTVVKSLGKRSLDPVPRSTLIMLKRYAFKCANKETSGTVTLNDVKYVGDVICGLEEADAKRLEDKFFTNRILRLGERCRLPLTVEKAMAARARAALKIVSMPNITTGQLVKMGPALIHLSDTEQSQINKTTLRNAVVPIMKSFKKRSNTAKRRQQMGMTSDLTDSENGARSQAQRRLFSILTKEFENRRLSSDQPATTQEAPLDGGNTTAGKREEGDRGPGGGERPGGISDEPGGMSNGLDGSGAGRKRRSITTSTMTCSDILRLGDAVVSLSTEQLNLADNEFLNCAETLGSRTDFSDEQKQALAMVATKPATWGPPGSWTASQIISAGVIAQGLSPAQLVLLDLNSIDTINALGAHTGWTSQQLSTILGRWLELTQNNDPSNIESTELKSIGEFACGATTSQISEIPLQSYKSAAAKIGELVSCDQSQMSAYANHATIAFGDVTSWGSSTVLTVGTMLGGLSSSELSSLTLPQIQVLQPKAISAMPPQTFARFTVSQLSQLSPAQAQSVTASQQEALTEDKMAALQSAGAVVRTDDGGQGNSATTMGCSGQSADIFVFSLVAMAFITQ